MPTMTMVYDGTVNLFDMALSIEAMSNVKIMSASHGGGVATFYYIAGQTVLDSICDYCGWDLPSCEFVNGRCPNCGAGGLG